MSTALLHSLLDAYETGKRLDPATLTAPVDTAAAMRIQAETAKALGAKISGWKVGVTGDGQSMAAALWHNNIVPTQAHWHLPYGCGVLIEIELAFYLSQDLPPPPQGQSYDRAEILRHCRQMHVGIEILASRLINPPQPPFLLWLSDRLGAAGYVIGAGRPIDPQFDLKNLSCHLWQDGKLLQERCASHPQGDPIEPILRYVNAPNDVQGGLRAGQLITTGALTRPLFIDGPCKIEAKIEDIGCVAVTLVA